MMEEKEEGRVVGLQITWPCIHQDIQHMHTLSCLPIRRDLPGVTLVILSGLPLIMHMVRAASLSAGSRDSVREKGRGGRREKGGKRGGREGRGGRREKGERERREGRKRREEREGRKERREGRKRREKREGREGRGGRREKGGKRGGRERGKGGGRRERREEGGKRGGRKERGGREGKREKEKGERREGREKKEEEKRRKGKRVNTHTARYTQWEYAGPLAASHAYPTPSPGTVTMVTQPPDV